MRVLVTGGSGFAGGVVRVLLEHGHDVWVLRRRAEERILAGGWAALGA